MSSVEALFLGAKAATKLWLFDDGTDDDGVALTPLGSTPAVAPGGEGGEALFTALYVTLTWTMGATVRVTPILDGTELPDEAADIVLASKVERTTDVFEIGLSVPYTSGGVEVGRGGMIGTRIAFRLEVVGGTSAGELIFDQLDLEHEVLVESGAPE